jgi:hypothetical protein
VHKFARVLCVIGHGHVETCRSTILFSQESPVMLPSSSTSISKKHGRVGSPTTLITQTTKRSRSHAHTTWHQRQRAAQRQHESSAGSHLDVTNRQHEATRCTQQRLLQPQRDTVRSEIVLTQTGSCESDHCVLPMQIGNLPKHSTKPARHTRTHTRMHIPNPSFSRSAILALALSSTSTLTALANTQCDTLTTLRNEHTHRSPWQYVRFW